MGGDTCHHSGEFRPSLYLPLPETISPSPLEGLSFNTEYRHVCPGSLFLNIHPEKSPIKPFYTLPENGISYDKVKALQSTVKMTEFDAADNVFVCIAHDAVRMVRSKRRLS